jgi:hypothetical protein
MSQEPWSAFHGYAYPEPDGFRSASLAVPEARYDTPLGEFLVPYDTVRRATDPDRVLLEFLQSTYGAAADLGGWDQPLLDQAPASGS